MTFPSRGTRKSPDRIPGVAVRMAGPADMDAIHSIVLEAATWLEEIGEPLWGPDEVEREVVAAEVDAGRFALASVGGEPAGAFIFTLSDPDFWPEVPEGTSAYIHRLAVRRRYAARGVSGAMLEWAKARARSMGLGFVRLDCDAARPKLRALYERHGYQFHSEFRYRSLVVARYELPLDEPA